jgi:hypothetical protein
VEGTPLDHGLRDSASQIFSATSAAFGGFFADGAGLFVLATESPSEAVAWLTAGGGWDPEGSPAPRAWSQTL